MASEPFNDFSLAAELRFDQLCRDFEKAWQAGDSPCLEDYLAQVSATERTALLEELLWLELEYRQQAHEALRLDDYLSRFPNALDQVKQVWSENGLPATSDSLHSDNDQSREQRVTSALHSDQQGNDPNLQDTGELIDRGQLGRYRLDRVLGRGTFAVVYLAFDEQLERLVAIKVPHPELFARPEYAEIYAAEARTVANLDHPNIVPVHDVGSTADCPCYVVSKYIEGLDLATRLKEGAVPHLQSVELVASLADALHYAHKQGLVHRDIKPSNILLDRAGTPHLADFGLALREENIGKGPTFVGTPTYMSPEQARGEGHRVDGRSDLFSLGIVLYELLVGRRPFRGETRAAVLEQVIGYEFRPLRQYDEHLPKELERICARAMAKRACERYTTAHDLAEDLRHLIATHQVRASASNCGSRLAIASARAGSGDLASSGDGRTSLADTQPLQVIPKALRSFDVYDSDFFLDLLPGPCDRDGLPERVRYWKMRIEETDPDQTFAVGLIYGPSGCGKSSLVKAGLLPRLAEDVIPIYLEATGSETEKHLLERMRKRFPALEEHLPLRETLTALRQGRGLSPGNKVLLVLDQFEQWLHTRKGPETKELVRALRQCDGSRVQCLLLVRDDFWLAISRFFHELEIRLVEGHNSALVDLFDLDHARKILGAFGRAFDKLPADAKETSEEQNTFLDQSIQGLAEEGKIICVRLALFAEMMKNKPWTSTTLRELGGATGVGMTFLEETFGSSTASPIHRYHQKAARAVLAALLPDAGTNIKGEMKSFKELLDASGYASSPSNFNYLIGLLDNQLRLITPTDPEGVAFENETNRPTEPGLGYFQLTHDYLVGPLRDWLTRKQQETRRGRAELQLQERSLLWNSKPEHQLLPSFWEYLTARILTDRRKWTEPQNRMMESAGRFHGIRTGIALALLLLIGLGTWHVWGRFQAASLVQQVASADTSQVPNLAHRLTRFRRWADPLLQEKFQRAKVGSPDKLNIALALLPTDASQVVYLRDQLSVCAPAQFPVVRDALLPHKKGSAPSLWQIVENEREKPAKRFQASAALARFAATDKRWRNIAPFVAHYLTDTVPPTQFGFWLDQLQSASGQLIQPLSNILVDRSRSEKQRASVANTLAYFLKGKPDRLTDLILVVENRAEFSPLLNALRPHTRDVKSRLMAEMDERLKTNSSVEERDTRLHRQSLAAVTLLHLGYPDEVWPMLQFTPDLSVRSFLILYLGKFQSDYNILAKQLNSERDPAIRRALLQALGGLDLTLIPTPDRVALAEQMQAIYLNDPDPGTHGSASWTLRQWGFPLRTLPKCSPQLPARQEQRIAQLASKVEDAQQNLQANPDQRVLLEKKLEEAKKAWLDARWENARRWFVNGQKQTFVVIPTPAEDKKLPFHLTFTIAVHEVTVSEYCRFRPEHRQLLDREIVLTDDCPVHQVTWYGAAEYCNWLSEQEGIPSDQWVYLPNANGEFAEGMRIKENYRELSGYRLPTESEWEQACRSGTLSSYSFGEPLSLMRLYAQYVRSSDGHSHPVESLLPNEWGLFDMHGNFWEWCQDVSPDLYSPVRNENQRVLRGGSLAAPPRLVKSDYRLYSPPNKEHIRHGFRVARTFLARP